MSRHAFEEQLDVLHRKLMSMGTLVEEAIHKSIKSLVERDVHLAEQVIAADPVINELEQEIQSECFRLIALQQPVGSDLRRLGTMLKLVTDLERMGDHAVSISKTTRRLMAEPYVKPLIDIPLMADHVKAMVRDCLNAYIARNKEAAEEIAARDDIVDKLFATIFRDLIEVMTKNGNAISQGTHLLLVAQYLERIADHVTNICEWIIYMSTGKMTDLNK
ncbi:MULTISPECIES: phosphate signaling complex protein PhoU [Brevibacillus]|jgi:phosphate transport system protein|uniref:phosphate signaling complex protein PhoU n=1 Tax=Brevibacillus TaxID=55080 RepID=UPI0007ABCEFA|nr:MULTISPECIES: phosphate signaling complex protein PhoU [Brevibacillus]TGV17684.1 phosphate signaling complex protein PhoU [Mesorhizobium sp. M00.F.Ca.ET.186.01.1.1]KZE48805.1 PhoU family transcriptional regulator [Brevibacillus parabrevis]MBU8712780.1 phosphate signaling complex protein PhoU [Brevibacillus parabrevis]MDH6348282.1 phosphate transport system protein [Brevibacillus sp. 1238]MDR5000403.1 phosphate signaling complex protein PhoU [Brevibacillus parabrevis]